MKQSMQRGESFWGCRFLLIIRQSLRGRTTLQETIYNDNFTLSEFDNKQSYWKVVVGMYIVQHLFFNLETVLQIVCLEAKYIMECLRFGLHFLIIVVKQQIILFPERKLIIVIRTCCKHQIAMYCIILMQFSLHNSNVVYITQHLSHLSGSSVQGIFLTTQKCAHVSTIN